MLDKKKWCSIYRSVRYLVGDLMLLTLILPTNQIPVAYCGKSRDFFFFFLVPFLCLSPMWTVSLRTVIMASSAFTFCATPQPLNHANSSETEATAKYRI